MVHRLKALSSAALFSVLAVFAPLEPAHAQAGGRLYVVEDVPIDVTAKSAVEARDQALTEGQREAFKRLMERLTPAGSTPPGASDSEIEGMVQGFQIRDERASGVRYLANLVVQFRPAAVQSFLSRRNVAAVVNAAPAVLIVPVLAEEGGAKLWDDPNPWREAWEQAPLGQTIVPITVPLGDARDLTGITPEQAMAGDEAALTTLAQRYGASSSVVAVARLGGTETQPAVNIQVNQIGGMPGPAIAETLTAEPGETREALLNRAIARISNDLDRDWKQQATIQPGMENTLTVTVPLTGLEDWMTVRRRLSGLPIVRKQTVKSLSRSEATVDIGYAGTTDQLRAALEQRNLALSEDATGWRLAAR